MEMMYFVGFILFVFSGIAGLIFLMSKDEEERRKEKNMSDYINPVESCMARDILRKEKQDIPDDIEVRATELQKAYNEGWVAGADAAERKYRYYIDKAEQTVADERPTKPNKCIWCDSPYRIEYYWIDRDGNTASFQDEDRHLVATGIAKYCPNCGRKFEDSENDRKEQ